MKIVEPKAELWIQNDPIEHVARCASTCYQSKEKEAKVAQKFYNTLVENKHLSMLRHESCYYIVKDSKFHIVDALIMYFKTNNPYIQIKFSSDYKTIYVATNANFVYDNPVLFDSMKDFKVSPEEFDNTEIGHSMMRYTLCLTTQISTSRELNRVSPNNIAEMSTRYIRFGGKIEPSIVRPWWFNKDILPDGSNMTKLEDKYFNSCIEGFENYQHLLDSGLKPEDARGVLPLDTMTKVIYTYSIDEWKHIINLRYHGTTGAPHKNAKIIIGLVRDELNKLKYEL